MQPHYLLARGSTATAVRIAANVAGGFGAQNLMESDAESLPTARCGRMIPALLSVITSIHTAKGNTNEARPLWPGRPREARDHRFAGPDPRFVGRGAGHRGRRI